MKLYAFLTAAVLIATFSLSAFAARGYSLNESQRDALVDKLADVYHGGNRPVSPYLGHVKVLNRQHNDAMTTTDDVSFDFLLYPVNDDTLEISGGPTVFVGCKAQVVFTARENMAGTWVYSAKFKSYTCEPQS